MIQHKRKDTGTPDIRTLRRHLRAIEREVEYQLKNQTECCGVTMAQCHVLLELEEAKETSLVELSERLKLDASTLSRTVDGLVRVGYVDRVSDPRSRRSIRLSLADEGKKRAEWINLSCNRFYRELLARVPKGRQATLVEALGLLAETFPRMREAQADPTTKSKKPNGKGVNLGRNR